MYTGPSRTTTRLGKPFSQSPISITTLFWLNELEPENIQQLREDTFGERVSAEQRLKKLGRLEEKAKREKQKQPEEEQEVER